MVDAKKEIRRQMDYAVKSRNRFLLYQTLGYINAAREAECITREDFVALSSECCQKINNPANFWR